MTNSFDKTTQNIISEMFSDKERQAAKIIKELGKKVLEADRINKQEVHDFFIQDLQTLGQNSELVNLVHHLLGLEVGVDPKFLQQKVKRFYVNTLD